MDSVYLYPFDSLGEAFWVKLMISAVCCMLLIPSLKGNLQESSTSKQKAGTKSQVWVEFLSSNGVQYPEIALCQVIQETGWMRSKLSRSPSFDSLGGLQIKGNNNILGMKINSRSYGISSSSYCPEQCFDCVHACYDRKVDCVLDYAEWQRQRFADYERYYGKPFRGSSKDYIKFLNRYVIYWPDGSHSWHSYAEHGVYAEKLQAIFSLHMEATLGTL